MKLMLDTNAWTAICAGPAEGLAEALESADEILIPVTVLGELFAGFQQGSKKESNITRLNRFLQQPGVVVVDSDRLVAERYGLLLKNLKAAGTPIPTNDIWIAAAALCRSASLVSRDHHFEVITGLEVLRF